MFLCDDTPVSTYPQPYIAVVSVVYNQQQQKAENSVLVTLSKAEQIGDASKNREILISVVTEE